MTFLGNLSWSAWGFYFLNLSAGFIPALLPDQFRSVQALGRVRPFATDQDPF